jgi:hypothetical protein
MDFWNFALNALQIGSIMATAGFAAFGLISKFKDENGTLTRAGRIALAGIGMSALLSLGTQSVKAETDRISAKDAEDKHQQELSTQLDLFKAQSLALTQLDSKQRRALQETQQIQGQVTRTLAGLQFVQDRVDQSVRAIGLVGQKQDIQTARVLRTMWEDANQIHNGSLQLTVVYNCPVKRGTHRLNILREGAVAIVQAIPLADAKRIGIKPTALQMVLPQEPVSLISTTQSVTFYPDDTGPEPRLQQISRFTHFIGEVPLELRSPRWWREAVVEMAVWTPFIPAKEELGEIAGTDLTPTEIGRLYDLTGVQSKVVSGLPCNANVSLESGGHIIAYSEGWVIRGVNPVTHDSRLMMKAEIVPVYKTAFPDLR